MKVSLESWSNYAKLPSLSKDSLRKEDIPEYLRVIMSSENVNLRIFLLEISTVNLQKKFITLKFFTIELYWMSWEFRVVVMFYCEYFDMNKMSVNHKICL